MVLALGILAYCGVHVALLEETPGTPPPPTDRAPILLVPFAIAVVAGFTGLLLYLYGGYGYGNLPRPVDQPVESREVTNSIFGRRHV